uniref:Zinc finger CCCH domain-containing protein 13-like n=1 Tax=Caenorhabditis tropicalis TaxID=1561998 RepID=A0A1I7UXR5_9PELO
MLPFVFNADEDGKKVRHEEANSNPNDHQQQINDYYKHYEDQRIANSFNNSTGRQNLAEIQACLAKTEQAIQLLKQEKEQSMYYRAPPATQHPILPDFNQPPPGFPRVSPVPQAVSQTAHSGGDKKRSRSPSWAREARRSRSRSRDRRTGRSRSRSISRRRSSRDRRDDRSSRRRRGPIMYQLS